MSIRMIRISSSIFLVLMVCGAIDGGPSARADDVYLTRIKPLLRERCYSCHGALKQEAGLRLDTVDLMLQGGDAGPVVVSGSADESELLARVSTDEPFDRMPPEHEGELFTDEQVVLLRDWILAGAPAPPDEAPERDPAEHWAFQAIVRPPVPEVEGATNPIDAFIARKQDDLGLVPQGEADRLLLLRRLSIDLIGLPPTLEEIDEAQRDPSPEWYDRTVDRLLDDPRHGERWARHWMDIWRYSDWWGLGEQLRNSQPHIWHWRDWIVESLNADLPYDEMVRSMLAADELYPNDLDRLRASGFLARNYFLFNRHQWMDETVEHVSKAFLGLTTNCAKCHDHKYDPISQADYYRLRAFFEPYHVRLDVRPGEADLARDGIPRAFDGLLEAPTYRFIRGEESNPDTSTPLSPNLPEVLRFKPLEIEPVDLPVAAWKPERRPWVAEAYRLAAVATLKAAEDRLATARASFDASCQDDAGTAEASPGDPSTPDAASEEARLALLVAERSRDAAEAELRSVELRIAALQTSWERDDRSEAEGAEAVALAEQALSSAREAARAEREAKAAQARLTLAEAELQLSRAAEADRDGAGKAVETARTALDEAIKATEEPGDQFTPLIGARWTPTRFLNSGQDDPTVAFPPQSTGRRKALADWITDPRNPLTARVAVNHVWTRHFGTPLVPTVFDFGRNGQPPTHPELLDWLAAELIEHDWSLKHLHRLIVRSAAYRRSSSMADAEENLAIDPDNRFLWRRTPIRIESQAVRDTVLSLAGTLDPSFGGPPVPRAAQEESNRRSLYFFHSNNERNLFLTMFDEALVKECYRRQQSIVPQQALALSNSRLVLDASPLVVARITDAMTAQGHEADDDEAFLRLAFVLVLGSEPSATEAAAGLRALDDWYHLSEASKGEDSGVFAREQLIWVLLNHNDFVTLR
ncbi:PSD1 and planctomycete cytochrome C domain-containing protein [Tautonia marina]|uniref:PSD1 and planctomycete cytochrome C domain-containing protein n=1 Tax=Tautonia marina TaxID=2653855 RepID=UPI001F1DC66A|nr:PSD1 and planctomycete cytochrome C domain-containing protein [Tautonia marina]